MLYSTRVTIWPKNPPPFVEGCAAPGAACFCCRIAPYSHSWCTFARLRRTHTLYNWDGIGEVAGYRLRQLRGDSLILASAGVQAYLHVRDHLGIQLFSPSCWPLTNPKLRFANSLPSTVLPSPAVTSAG